MKEKVFKDGFRVFYDDNTFKFKAGLDCEHYLILIDFKIANGTFQLRNYCTKCLSVIGKALKHDDYKNKNVLTKDFSKYKEFREQLDYEQMVFIQQLIKKGYEREN